MYHRNLHSNVSGKVRWTDLLTDRPILKNTHAYTHTRHSSDERCIPALLPGLETLTFMPQLPADTAAQHKCQYMTWRLEYGVLWMWLGSLGPEGARRISLHLIISAHLLQFFASPWHTKMCFSPHKCQINSEVQRAIQNFRCTVWIGFLSTFGHLQFGGAYKITGIFVYPSLSSFIFSARP
jgi:hypothetical protein